MTTHSQLHHNRSRGSKPRTSRSWLDALFAWIEELPGPTWLPYVLMGLLSTVLGHGLRWLDGSLAPGTFDLYRFAGDPLAVYGVALLHYLNRTARTAMAVFRPALGKLEANYEQIEHDLTGMPQRLFIAAVLVGLPLSYWSLRADPGGWGLTPGASIGTAIVSILQGSLLVTSSIVLLVHSVYQLRLITRIHREASNVSLYGIAAHHAFSRLTLRTAIGVTLPVYWFSFLAYLTYGAIGMSGIDTAMVILVLVISGLLFGLPLNGMHHRLVHEKSRLLQEVGRRIERVTHDIHERLDANAVEELGNLNNALSALAKEKEILGSISTWPWEPGTLRGYLSSIGIPILLWFITRYLGRLVQ